MEAVFEEHKDLIVKAAQKVVPRLKAIILYGGYGRDEGSWVIENGRRCRPYNDYDILLIVENKIAVEQIDPLRKDLATQIGIRWVDIGQNTSAELQKLRPSIYSYDLKYASKVIQGDQNVLRLIPKIDVAKLPLREGEVLFFTRLWTLSGSLDRKGFRVDRKGEESRFFRNQMAKAVLAVVDVLLLQKGAYHPSYKKRVSRFNELYPAKKDLIKLAEWALEEKLFPKAPDMRANEIKELYEKVHYYFFIEMYQLLTHYYGRNIDNPMAVEKNLKWAPINLVKRTGWIILRRNLNWERRNLVKLAQCYIAAAFNGGSNCKEFLEKGIKYIRCLDSSFAENVSWDEARVQVAELRMEV